MTGPRFGLLAYQGIANLGDTIQSLAARRYLPQVDVLVERERISQPPGGGRCKVILNGWFMHDAAHWPPHPDIEPLPLSMHFVPPGVSRLRRWARTPTERMLSGAGGDYLRRWGPIGARDLGTLAQLKAHDIPAYHSGCLTLTLRRAPVARSDHVVACDLSPAALAQLRCETQRPIVEVTHLGGETLDHAAREAAAERLLAIYASAAAVVTTRIHAAMPCLALDTPVLLMIPPRPPRRVTDVARLMHSCDESAFLRGDCDYSLSAPPANPAEFRKLAAPLEQACRRFTGFDRCAARETPPSPPLAINTDCATRTAMARRPELMTVVMPVYNALPFLDEAIASIVAQTHRQFRLAIYDDHSTDGSYDAALAWAARDPRISVVRGAVRLGPSASSNAAAALASTELVARMDADDLMEPDRLEAQLAALAQFPGAVLVGSTFDMIDHRGHLIWRARPGRVGGDHPPIAHPSILYRRAAFDAIGGYRENTDYFEDHDLYLRIAKQGEVVVVNRPLIKVRFAGQHARLSDDPEAVLDKINRHYAPSEATGDARSRISPMAFYSIANLAMLSSRRPRILPLMLRRVSYRQPGLALIVTAIVALTEISPSLARAAWQNASAIRNRLEKKAASNPAVYVWNPPGDGD